MSKQLTVTTPQDFSHPRFFNKLGRVAKRLGRGLVERALLLYYAAQRPETPTWAKSVIYGALGYFILPLDAIPDVIPGAGFTDDFGALAAAIAVVTFYITPAVRQQAETKLAAWFGPRRDAGPSASSAKPA